MIGGQFSTELRRIVHRRVLVVFALVATGLLFLTGLGVYSSSGPAEVWGPIEGPGGSAGDQIVTVESTFCPSDLVIEPYGSAAFDDPDLVAGCPVTTPDSFGPGASPMGHPEMYFPWNGTIAMFTVVALLAVWVLVASLVGAEFRHGTVETALVAEPRRARLLTLRLGAVVVVGTTAYLLAALGFLLAMAPAWVLRSIEGTSVPASLVAGAIGRGLLAAVVICVLSASLAVLGRGSLLPVGVLVGLAAATGVLFVFLRDLVPLEFFTNTWAVVTGGNGIRTYEVGDAFLAERVDRFGLGWPFAGAVAVVTGYALVALACAYGSFIRRDVR